MGHYRSEMGLEGRDEQERIRREEKLDKFEKKMQAMIDEKGIARVLSEMVAASRAGDGLCGFLGY